MGSFPSKPYASAPAKPVEVVAGASQVQRKCPVKLSLEEVLPGAESMVTLLEKHEQQQHLVVLDFQVDHTCVLLNAILPTCAVVLFNSEVDTKEDLAQLIRAAHLVNGKPFSTCALFCHGGERWHIAADCKPHMAKHESIVAETQKVLSSLVGAVNKMTGRIDLLGCSLLKSLPDLVAVLEDFYGINFAASNDKTGNLEAGGDWVLESDGIDVSSVYFNKEDLKLYKEVMWFMDVIDVVPLVGGVARTVEAGVHFSRGDGDAGKAALANAGMNFAGDALGVATGGTGKVAMVATRAGAKVVAKAGVKAAARAAWKAAAKKLTKKQMKAYRKKYFKKKKRADKMKQIKEMIEEGAEVVREDLERLLEEGTGADYYELERLSNEELQNLAITAAQEEEEEDEDEEW